jgi:hypothetical protein
MTVMTPLEQTMASVLRAARARGGTVNIRAMRRAHRDVEPEIFARAIDVLQQRGDISLEVRPA